MSDLADLGPVWLLGCGNMGGALLGRWVAAGLRDVTVIDPAPRGLPATVMCAATPPASGTPAIIVLAVKPQHWAVAVEPLRTRLSADTLAMSIMAGVSCAALAARLGCRSVVRTMPNTPARIGRGVTALYAHNAAAGARHRAEALMAAAGATVWLDDEAQFDAVTAVSGSGPAYVYAFIEALAAAAAAAGLPRQLADTLARSTVTGAAALADSEEASPAALRAAVTSPGGTTAAGLAALDGAGGLSDLLRATVAAARERSRELSRFG